MTKQEHRDGTISLYKNQLISAGDFMTAVLNEAIRKLEESEIPTKKIEDWVVKIEKDWINI